MFRYLMDNLDWLEDELGSFDDDYLLIDCPGKYKQLTIDQSLYHRSN